MILADFKCDECGEIKTESKRKVSDDFSVVVCDKCGKEMRRLFTSVLCQVARGMTGNSETGFQSEVAYHPASATGRGKRTKIK